MARSATLLLLLAAALGCRSRGDRPATPAPPPPQGQAPAQGAVLEGTVQERLEAPPYSYLRLQTAAGEAWVAVPATAVAPGTRVRVLNPMEQANWQSPQLQRTFARVYLGTLEAGPGTAPAHPPVATPPAEAIHVARAEGPEGRTVAELHAQGKALDGKLVAVRGRIVKRTEGIAVKGIPGGVWIHLQDGTGSAQDRDLTVTTDDPGKVGDVVVARGRLKADAPIGAGYDRPVLLVGARLVR
jgi:hypothetical protein